MGRHQVRVPIIKFPGIHRTEETNLCIYIRYTHEVTQTRKYVKLVKIECQFNEELYKIIEMFSIAKFTRMKIDRFYVAIIFVFSPSSFIMERGGGVFTGEFV